MKIFNDADDTILLQGEQSSVVDPDGRSHPMQSQTLAGRSFVKLVLPPPRPWGTGGPVAFELAVADYPGGSRYGYADAGPDYPAPADRIETYDSPVYWNWTGQAPIRVDLVYRRLDTTFGQRFTIRKQS